MKPETLRKTFAMLGLVGIASLASISAGAGFPAHAQPPSAAACVAAHRLVIEQRADSDTAAATDDAAVKAQAAAAFTQCSTQRFGPTAAVRAPVCEADLYTLPVLLLYRADGLSRSQALADLQRPGNEASSPAEARRTADMLAFAYQGRGPTGEGGSAWIAKRTDEWTRACLNGQR